MNPDIFDAEEQEIRKVCLGAIKHLPAYEDDAFEHVFGLTKRELAEIEARWPDWDFQDEESGEPDHSWLAVNNALVWIVNGSERDQQILRARIPYDASMISSIYDKFREL